MFFKAIGKMKSDRRGFTLTELMVTIVIMALIAGTIALIAGNIWKRYRLVENRYIVQTEVKAIADAFTADASTGSLATSTNVDLMYEDLDAVKTNKQFASCPELGNFTEDEDSHSLTFPKRAKSYIAQLESKVNNGGTLTETEKLYYNGVKYTYLFVYDSHFYVLNGNKDTAYRFYYTDEVAVNIKYSVSVDAFQQVLDSTSGKYVESDVRSNNLPHKYINAVTVSIASDPSVYQFTYELLTSFSLKNISGENLVNMNNADGVKLTNQYIAGYTSGKISEYPSGSKLIDEASDETLQRDATIIKYIALSEFNSSSATGNNGSANVGFNCSTSFLMMGSKVGEGVLNTLRDFRDNTLRGNALGELVIEKYYAWSPTLISIFNEHKLIRDISARLVTDTAYLIEMTKK